MSCFVHVALPVPVDRLFTYSVPIEAQPSIAPGLRVLVPFGRRVLTGMVIECAASTDLDRTRAIRDILDDSPLFDNNMLRFASWMSEYYLAPIGEVIRTMLPGRTSPHSVESISLTRALSGDEISALRSRAPVQGAIVLALTDNQNSLTLPQLRKLVEGSNVSNALRDLEQSGVITRRVSVKRRSPRRRQVVSVARSLIETEGEAARVLDELDKKAPRQSALLSHLIVASERTAEAWFPMSELLRSTGVSSSVVHGLESKGYVIIDSISEAELALDGHDPSVITHGAEERQTIVATEEQSQAVETISQALGSFRAFLLHGATGSGKTWVYIQVMKQAIARGKKALMLVPEIALTVQLVERLKEEFGDETVLLHSRMSESERYDGWNRARKGECNLVIGPRSALFAPIQNVGVIVVDEEHEGSYKQYDKQPRYHARDSAVVRGEIENAVVILGSATPSVESYFNASEGKYTLVSMPNRVDGAKPPVMETVNTRTARKQNLMRGALSVKLIAELQARIDKKEGSILFLNRRGFSACLECTDCGHAPICPDCDVTLTYHKGRGQLRCHYCGYVRDRDRTCEMCGHHDLRQPGTGTERIEEELAEHLPEARVRRMDLDTTRKKGAHARILGEFGRGEADILLGTQMVAKGLDFARVTLIGVISADLELRIPDFRSGERTFQLITQVAGRAGRRAEAPGTVIVQSNEPEHPAIQLAMQNNYQGMYEAEILHRRSLMYPPFSRFILVEIRSKTEERAQEHARMVRDLIPNYQQALHVLGPTPALIAKLRGWYRFHITIKNPKDRDRSGKSGRSILRRVVEEYQRRHASKDVVIIVDVDAYSVL